MNGFGKKMIKVVAIALVFGLVAGAAFQGSYYVVGKLTGNEKVSADATETSTGNKGEISGTAVSTATTVSDVSDIVDNVMPSIVAVTNISYSEYRNFFGGTQTYESESAGSGIIISQDDENLYIATNNHVVSGAESLTITFCDEKAVPATVKGTDASVDLAVVAVSLKDVEDSTKEAIKVATVGDSSKLTVGESAVVIGNALGYGQSVTTGVISALEREVQLQDESGKTIKNKLLQTDAAVNPGNSGGALLNMKGEVVGIVSAKYSDTSVEGMGYAIPISSAQSIIEGLITRQEVSEGDASYFGIAGVDVTSDVSGQYDIPSGVYVTKVAANSGAGKAGIKKGDVITKFDGKEISSMEEISDMMQYISAGTKVKVTVAQSRNGYKETELEVTLTNKK
ncbi:MAG: trypsin-like peptidase domain-containing protein [Lachnospiraceae bacterium]|nr:trypsin-like peptidase domain-containing protein [Lachnospiraceae bacterium]MDD6191704.1 trypsin-like peptidase domain-containing protein [Lachnospiraceae bacterium]MDY4793666.1 trypsin-like peptidase domain-containing protein [Pararoseburia sp.]